MIKALYKKSQQNNNHKTGLTTKQQNFIIRTIQTQNPSQASREVYNTKNDSTARSIASQNMKKPKIRNAIEKALYTSKIDEQRLTNIIGQALNTDSPDVIDWNTKHSYTVTALKLLGHLQSNNTTNIQTNIGLDISE